MKRPYKPRNDTENSKAIYNVYEIDLPGYWSSVN